MALSNKSDFRVETAQANCVRNASGKLNGSFCLGPWGWELELTKLTFPELLRIVEAARRVLEL